MSSTPAAPSVPVIDISALVEGRAGEHASIADQLREAARDVGFFYISGHGIPQAQFDDLRRAAEAFFAQPLEEKMKVYIGRSNNHRGYVPEGEEVFEGGTKDKKEAFDLSMELPADDPAYRAGTPFLGPNQWPALPGFSPVVLSYHAAVFDLGRKLMHGLAMALGEAPEHFDTSISKPPSQLRLIHYPFNPDSVDSVGIGAHSDYECFTLLYVTTPGLEVLNRQGEWVDVPPLPGTFIVNIGDLMEVLSNGEFRAAIHRVRKTPRERYSFPLFFMLDYDTQVAPLNRFVGPDGVRRKPLLAGDHLFTRTVQSFNYLRQRLARGEISLPEQAGDAEQT